MTLKKPRLYVKPGESYDAALQRWRVRYADYRDALVIKTCHEIGQDGSTRRKHFLRAFYGLPMGALLDSGVLD